MKERLLRILLVAGCLYATACTLNRETIAPGAEAEGEEVAVTFLLSAEGQMVSSRAGDDEDKPVYAKRTISDGTGINKVVYAVYVKTYDTDEKTGQQTWNDEYRLLDQYGAAEEDNVLGLGVGQALLPSTENLRSENGESFSLRLMRGQEYVIAFWAQNKDCKAYNAKDLENVIVDYKAEGDALAANNDETRDAFCQVYTFTAQIGVTEKVVLKRAMAQVNVGTAGWDYNNEVDYGNSYAYSKIEMTGVKNKLNVLTGEAKVEEINGFDGTVTYDWAMLPAYIRLDKYPEYNDDGTEKGYAKFAEWLKNPENDQEYLYVKLLADDPKYKDYITDEPENETEICTEVFKYLSMCYVLAPTPDEDKPNSGLALNSLTFYLAEYIDGGKGYVYEDMEKTKSLEAPVRFTLADVPVQRNWRTNILGGVRGGEDNSLFDPRSISLWIDLAPSYDGDHYHYDSGQGDDTDWEHNKFPEEDAE